VLESLSKGEIIILEAKDLLGGLSRVVRIVEVDEILKLTLNWWCKHPQLFYALLLRLPSRPPEL
jgi:hypothetical protein